VRNDVVESEESEDNLVVIEQEEEIASEWDSEESVSGIEELQESEVDEPQSEVHFEAEPYEPENVSSVPSESPTIPYSEGSPHPSIAEELDEENEADSESSEVESNSSTSPVRRSGRGRVPKSVFTYNDFGNPTIVRQ
jgi:hypothetical protein